MKTVYGLLTAITLSSGMVACGGGGDGSNPLQAPTNLYYQSPQSYIAGEAIAPLDPKVTGNSITYSVSPTLPTGLTISSSTGEISGTPATAAAATSFTVTAQNASGATVFLLNIAIQIAKPSALSYTALPELTVGVPMTPITPTVSGTVTSFTISPSLPSGLAMNASTGQISGTPSSASAAATYVVVAQNSSGSVSFNLPLTVVVPAPAAAAVSVAYGIRQIILNWTAPTGATYFDVLKSADGSSNYIQLVGNLSNLTYTDVVPVHLTDWVNARYIVKACNSTGCTSSPAISATASQQAIGYFKASNTRSNAAFGTAVAISNDGNTLVVGAPYESSDAIGVNGDQTDTSDPAAGAAYVFIRVGNSWQQHAYLKESNTDASDFFGWSVAISGDGNTIAIGSIGESSSATGINGNQTDNSAPSAGAVYVFVRTGAGWSQQAYVKASNTVEVNAFGGAVALNGDGGTLAVGAVGESSRSVGINGDETQSEEEYAGAVYVYTRNGTTWTQQAYVKSSYTYFENEFGYAVALSADGNTLGVGSPGESSTAVGVNGPQNDLADPTSGCAYVFTRLGSSWSQQAFIKASNTASEAEFGYALAMSADGNTIAFSAVTESSSATGVNGNQTNSDAPSAGAVYLFSRTAGTWAQQDYFKASNTLANQFFGSGLAISADGSTLAVGASHESSAATGINGNQSDVSLLDNGAAYVFTMSAGQWSQRSYVKASDAGAYDFFGNAVSLSGDGSVLAVGASGESGASTGIQGSQLNDTASGAGATFIY